MFGRVRASSSSVDSLERPPSKIFKDDPLSIYETTLMKLKEGAQRDLSWQSEEASEMESENSATNVSTSKIELPPLSSTCTTTIVSENSLQFVTTSDDDEAMVIDTDSSSSATANIIQLSCSSSASASHSTTLVQCTSRSNSRSMPLHYLFSRYNSSRHELSSSSSHGELMNNVSYASAAPTTSPSSSNYHSQQHLEHQSHISSSQFSF